MPAALLRAVAAAADEEGVEVPLPPRPSLAAISGFAAALEAALVGGDGGDGGDGGGGGVPRGLDAYARHAPLLRAAEIIRDVSEMPPGYRHAPLLRAAESLLRPPTAREEQLASHEKGLSRSRPGACKRCL